ncbi:MAG: hypothetical protein R2714_00925 [Microthrixaceae bacterium]|nr:hypothetical protein [Microthrixaceae bacterium]
MDSPSTPAAREPMVDDSSQRRRRIALVAAALFAVGTFGFWIWLLFVYDAGLLVDELADKTFPTEAEQVCSQAEARISLLPPAQTADDPLERADVIDQANESLTIMLAQLGPLAPTEPPEAAEAVQEWLDDWATHLKDRTDYAAALRSDPEARFTETTKGSKQISRAIDSFAEVNRMASCSTPGDVG